MSSPAKIAPEPAQMEMGPVGASPPVAPEPVLGAPQQEQMGGTGTSIFGSGRITVKQIISTRSIIEVLTACDLNNRYDLTVADGRKYFLKEDTSCLCRQCLKQHRAWKVHIFDTQTRDENAKILYTGHKENITCHDCFPLCMFPACRPEMRVMNGDGKKIGWVQDPFHCCHVTEQVKGADGHDLYNLEAFICQIGFWCPVCADVEMPIHAVHGRKEGEGVFTKRAGGITECLCGDLNTKIEIDLPKDCDTDDKKALLVMTGVLLDMTYFENNIKPKNK
mmetsp:Transcript_18398/g.45955  ORF Transcript_18398/g.45955 Transcript_18398/m.45955 type:complete len:278 (+) Transcript_18398:193-1026(+)